MSTNIKIFLQSIKAKFKSAWAFLLRTMKMISIITNKLTMSSLDPADFFSHTDTHK